MPDQIDHPPVARLARWKARRSTRVARWCWGTIFLIGFLIWSWRVGGWAKHNGHIDWVDDSPRPLYLLFAFVTYWPPVIAVWHLLYPDDPRPLPWADKDD